LILVVVGDGEEVIVEIMSEVARKKREGAERADIVNSLFGDQRRLLPAP